MSDRSAYEQLSAHPDYPHYCQAVRDVLDGGQDESENHAVILVSLTLPFAARVRMVLRLVVHLLGMLLPGRSGGRVSISIRSRLQMPA